MTAAVHELGVMAPSLKPVCVTTDPNPTRDESIHVWPVTPGLQLVFWVSVRLLDGSPSATGSSLMWAASEKTNRPVRFEMQHRTGVEFEADTDEPITIKQLAAWQRQFVASVQHEFLDVDLPDHR
jgi:hypothetical protein